MKDSTETKKKPALIEQDLEKREQVDPILSKLFKNKKILKMIDKTA